MFVHERLWVLDQVAVCILGTVRGARIDGRVQAADSRLVTGDALRPEGSAGKIDLEVVDREYVFRLMHALGVANRCGEKGARCQGGDGHRQGLAFYFHRVLLIVFTVDVGFLLPGRPAVAARWLR